MHTCTCDARTVGVDPAAVMTNGWNALMVACKGAPPPRIDTAPDLAPDPAPAPARESAPAAAIRAKAASHFGQSVGVIRCLAALGVDLAATNLLGNSGQWHDLVYSAIIAGTAG